MQRLNESAQMSEWLAKDDDFRLDQRRQRTVIRIKERRAKAVDFLSLNLRYANPDSEEDANSTSTNQTTSSMWVSYFPGGQVRVFTVSLEPVSGTGRHTPQGYPTLLGFGKAGIQLRILDGGFSPTHRRQTTEFRRTWWCAKTALSAICNASRSVSRLCLW